MVLSVVSPMAKAFILKSTDDVEGVSLETQGKPKGDFCLEKEGNKID